MAETKTETKKKTTSKPKTPDLFGVTTKEEAIAKAAEVLANTLQKIVGPEVLERIQPILGPLTALAVTEGIDQAQHILVVLTQEDSYPGWEKLIEVSSPETRIDLMEKTRQDAIADTLKLIARNKQRWEVLQTILSVAGSLLLGLLL